jgi:SPASM domain peptide maturase of grasp-with-spasm system
VKGSIRSLVCDLQRFNLIFIPNDFYEMLNSKSVIDVKDICSQFHGQEDVILEYFTMLEEQSLGQFIETDYGDMFPALSLEWFSNSYISDCILDLNELNLSTLESIFSQLEQLLCKNIQIRFFSKIDLSSLDSILNQLSNSKIRSIEFYIIDDEKCSFSDYNDICDKHERIKTLFVYSTFPNRKSLIKDKLSGHIVFINENIPDQKNCGIISKSYFAINLENFSEAQKHNSCLNRKISIDVNGEIKNCPSMSKGYGNIKDTTLAEAIEKPGFKDMWYINKDQIAVCKDCEFRYICTDCRAYIENPEDIYSKPLKCGYNPYTAEWEDWSTNPLKQKAIEYYGMQELVKKEK